MKTVFLFRRVAPLAVCSLLAAALGGCGGPAGQELSVPDAQTLAEDQAYLTALLPKDAPPGEPQTLVLDVSDERQYRVLANRLLAAGHTPERSPELFDALRRMREQHLAAPKKSSAMSAMNACDNYILTVTPVTGTTAYNAKSAFSSSVVRYYLYTDVTAMTAAYSVIKFNSKELYNSASISVSTSASGAAIFDSTLFVEDYDGVVSNCFRRVTL